VLDEVILFRHQIRHVVNNNSNNNGYLCRVICSTVCDGYVCLFTQSFQSLLL